MIESFIHATEHNNLYLYDDKHALSLLIHPDFRKAHEKSSDVDLYYLDKYKYFRKHGFLSKFEYAVFGSIDESQVKNNIDQTNQIAFETTDSCNLNCTYCGFGELYEGFDERNQKKINTRNAIILLKYIFDQKYKSNNNKLNIGFYGGEPLLNFLFIKRIVEVSKQLNIEKELDLDYSMTTNATLIHKHINFLVANQFRLLISLDGNEKNHSYRIFGKSKKNSFSKVIENLDMIQRDYPVYFANNVIFNAVLHDRNSVKDIFEFIYTRYHKIPRISELNSCYLNAEQKNIFEKIYHSKRKSEDEYLMEESDLSHITRQESIIYNELWILLKYYSVNFYVSNITALLYDKENYYPTSTCLPFGKNIFLTNRNKLLPCEKVSNEKYSMGTVNKEVIIDIPEITRLYNSYIHHLEKVCKYCYAYKFCGICMFQINNLDKLDKEDFICDIFFDQKAFQKKMFRIFSYLEKYPDDFSKILKI